MEYVSKKYYKADGYGGEKEEIEMASGISGSVLEKPPSSSIG